MSDLTREDLERAIASGTAVAQEWEGASIHDKLRALGLDADMVADLLHERWETHKDEAHPGDDPFLSYAQGFTEGIIVLAMLWRHSNG